MNLLNFADSFPDEASCKAKFKEYRDKQEIVCPQCGSVEHYWKWDKENYECKHCVERTFGSIKKWFGGNTARYVGLEKTHTQHVLQAIAHNLKRAPGIIVSNSLK